MANAIVDLNLLGQCMSELYYAYVETAPIDVSINWSGKYMTVVIEDRSADETYELIVVGGGRRGEVMMSVVRGNFSDISHWCQTHLAPFPC